MSNTGSRQGRDTYRNSTPRSSGALPSYSAQYGEKGGNTTTIGRSGFDTTRNNAFDLTRNNAFDANNIMTLTTPGGYVSAASPSYFENSSSNLGYRGGGGDNGGRGDRGGGDRGDRGSERGDRGDRGDRNRSNPRSSRQGDILYDHVLSAVAERVAIASTERGRSLGAPFSLLKLFQVYEDGSGSVSERVFESTLGECSTLRVSRVRVCECA